MFFQAAWSYPNNSALKPWHSHPWRGAQRDRNVVLRTPGDQQRPLAPHSLMKSCENKHSHAARSTRTCFLPYRVDKLQHSIWVCTFATATSWLRWKSASLIWKQLYNHHHSSVTFLDLLLNCWAAAAGARFHLEFYTWKLWKWRKIVMAIYWETWSSMKWIEMLWHGPLTNPIFPNSRKQILTEGIMRSSNFGIW